MLRVVNVEIIHTNLRFAIASPLISVAETWKRVPTGSIVPGALVGSAKEGGTRSRRGDKVSVAAIIPLDGSGHIVTHNAVDVPAVLSGDLALPPPGESTAVIAHRVAAARARQAGR